MTNYASISEAITKKLNNAETRLNSLEALTDSYMSNIEALEARYNNGEDVGKQLDKAYRIYNKTCAEHEAIETAYNNYREASDLYKRVCRLIDIANDVEINGL